MQGVLFLCDVTTLAILEYYVPRRLSTSTRQGSLKMYAEGGHHPQQELDRFGHRSERKVENFKNPLRFGHFAGTYCLNMTNPNNIFSKSGNFGAFFL